MKKKIIIVVVCIVIILVAKLGWTFIDFGNELKNLPFQTVNMEDVQDGMYEGSLSTSMIKVKVAVTVQNQKIQAIEIIEHQNGMGKPAEVIVDDMVKKNTDQVDTISGATASSDVIKSAVNQALNKGVKK